MELNCGATVSTVTSSAVEAVLARLVVVDRLPTLTAWFWSVCVAVIACRPSSSVKLPLVMIFTVVPVLETVPWPISVPSANSWTSALESTPLTWNSSVFCDELLFRFVRSLDEAVPLLDRSSIAVGAAGSM